MGDTFTTACREIKLGGVVEGFSRVCMIFIGSLRFIEKLLLNTTYNEGTFQAPLFHITCRVAGSSMIANMPFSCITKLIRNSASSTTLVYNPSIPRPPPLPFALPWVVTGNCAVNISILLRHRLDCVILLCDSLVRPNQVG